MLFLMCGLPGSGKTTEARRLESSYPAVRLCPDDWLRDLHCNLFHDAMRDRIELLQWQLAQRLLTLGQSVILESGFWTRNERDEKRVRARSLGAGVVLCYLDTPVPELISRVSARHAADPHQEPKITAAMFDTWSAMFQAPTAEEQALFDQETKA